MIYLSRNDGSRVVTVSGRGALKNENDEKELRKEDSMKKANKKISRLLKVTLLLCMIFSQLASPIEVLADQIVPSYNIDMVLDTENDKFVVTSNGTKELVEDENYILEITRSFMYTDNTLNEEENKTTYSLVLGGSLNTGIDVEHETFIYNGVSYIDINVY